MELFTQGLSLGHYLALGAVLFCISGAGIFLNRKNVIILLMSIELMLLAVNVNFVAFSREAGDADGQVFVFFIFTVAAAEDRLSVVSGRSGSVRDNRGVRRLINKKPN